MSQRGQALARRHQLAQINNAAGAAALVMELGEELRLARINYNEFMAAVVAQGQLSHRLANQLARQFIIGYRDIEAPEVNHAPPVYSEFDQGAALGRAVGTLEDIDELDRSDEWYNQAFWRLIGSLAVRQNRAALNGARDTVAASSTANGRRWRRITDGNPCSFCAMLATRSDYTSRESAGSVVSGRGKRPLGEQYHDYCGCSVVEVLTDWEPNEAEARHRGLYDRVVQALKDAGQPGTTSNVLSKMRELGHGVLHDAHVPKAE